MSKECIHFLGATMYFEISRGAPGAPRRTVCESPS